MWERWKEGWTLHQCTRPPTTSSCRRSLRATTGSATSERSVMTRVVIAELKALRLHGMAGTWADLIEQNNAELDRSRWLVEQMLRGEMTERVTRSVSHQM